MSAWIHDILQVDMTKESMPPLDEVMARGRSIKKMVMAGELSVSDNNCGIFTSFRPSHTDVFTYLVCHHYSSKLARKASP